MHIVNLDIVAGIRDCIQLIKQWLEFSLRLCFCGVSIFAKRSVSLNAFSLLLFQASL